jgi:hypothetical protein
MSQTPQNTVFVIGAGASEEANFPTSQDLRNEISKLLNINYKYGNILESGDQKIVDALELHMKHPDDSRGNIEPYLKAAWHISDALPQAISIDNFIDAHRDNEKIAFCGKLAIARSILNAEKESLLHFVRERVDSSINFNALAKTWYEPFFQLLTEYCSKDDLKTRFESLTLIIFNYDRCIEHFLYYNLQNYYKLSDIEAAKMIKNIIIYHPYGSVGTLPWINPNVNEAVAFGIEPNPKKLLNIAAQIKTFTEGSNPNSKEILKIQERLEEAHRIVFLGFAFHKLNMYLITPTHENSIKKCFATTFDFSESDKEIIKEQIEELYGNFIEVKMKNLKCNAFFSYFWRSLAF